MSPWCVWTGAGQRRDRLADPGSLCWQPSAVFAVLGRCYEGEEARALHADQWVGGSLQEQDRAGDALKPHRHIDHGCLDGFQVPRRLGEVQKQLTGITGGQLPGTAPLHGKEQRPSGSCGSQWPGNGREQPGQGSSSQQCAAW